MLQSILLSLTVFFTAAATADEQVLAAVLFHRHGDRTAKQTPPTVLTTLGEQQCYQSGQFWRTRYLEASSEDAISGMSTTYKSSSLYAAAPDSGVLVTSGQAFLQGLYPPVSSDVENLANGTDLESPLSGYQYAELHTISDDSPATLWLKGDESCPSYTTATQAFNKSAETKELISSKQEFYDSLYDDYLSGVFTKEESTYENAYMIFDYLNVASIHNSSIDINSDILLQARTLADAHEWAINANITSSSDPKAVSGRTLSSAIVSPLDDFISSSGQETSLNVLFGSYDTFLAFFALAGLEKTYSDFYGLPDYASVLAFELISNVTTDDAFPADEDLYVRFLVRNGTDLSIEAEELNLFGADRNSWTDFKRGMEDFAIDSASEWCAYCASTEEFCAAYGTDVTSTTIVQKGGGDKLTPAQAGSVGAVCALAVVALGTAIAAAMGCRMRRKQKPTQQSVVAGGKGDSASQSTV